MENNNIRFDFIKNRKIWMIIYAAIIVAGIVVFTIFGANLSIDFKGGTYFNYTFTGDLDVDAASKLVKDTLKVDVVVTQSEGYATNEKSLVVTVEEDENVSVETQQKLIEALNKAYPNNKIALGESNAVGASIASNFFVKCLVAVLLASALVIVYVGIRFRKIGGVSAGMFALMALLLDCLMAFLACVFFRLEIDSNFMSVILTTLGYSLNDTIVVYDRIRENDKLYPQMDLRDKINLSVNQSLGRTIKTTVATFLAIIAIVVVAEFFGLTSLRSFAIPMSVGIISGCVTSVCLSSPLWYSWRKASMEKKAKKEA